nr:gag pol polyprotein [Hymenolepis microstoma]CUU99106.1 gag pol polyprotein [Hymenolepis microstoma]
MGCYQTDSAVQPAIAAPPSTDTSRIFDVVDDEKRLQQLLSIVDLGVPTPFQLRHPVQSLASATNLDDSILRHLWIKCLPVNMVACLATRTYSSNLYELAEVADRIQEICSTTCSFGGNPNSHPRHPTTM